MDELSDALSEQQQALKKVIALWRESELLWNPEDPDYKNRSKRQEAYKNIENKYREHIPSAQEDYIKVRLDSMRSSFRREHHKVKANKAAGKIYKPTLWYYDLLLFLVQDESSITAHEDIENYHTDTKTYWTREYSAYLIDIFKKYKCVYDPKCPGYSRKHEREEAYKKITQELMAKTNKKFDKREVNKKIQFLKGQYRVERTKIKRSKLQGDQLYKPSLWCFKLLSFLQCMSNKNTIEATKNRKKITPKLMNYEDSSEEDYLESVKLEYEPDYPEREEVEINHLNLSSSKNESENDIFDTIGKNVAHKLRDMSELQQQIAEKLLSEIMYHGQMEELNDKSRFSLNGK